MYTIVAYRPNYKESIKLSGGKFDYISDSKLTIYQTESIEAAIQHIANKLFENEFDKEYFSEWETSVVIDNLLIGGSEEYDNTLKGIMREAETLAKANITVEEDRIRAVKAITEAKMLRENAERQRKKDIDTFNELKEKLGL